ncbi:MAG: hypothetical protein V1834_02240 [Candidatus Micrarchaeota archaeon]
MKKAQAGMEFMATYGWALLILGVVLVSLFSLGVFNVNFFAGRQAVGFTNLVPVDWDLHDGTLKLVLKNNAGVDVTVNEIQARVDGTPATYSTPFSITEGGESSVISIGGFLDNNQGVSFNAALNISFHDDEAGFDYVETGKLTGEES